MVTHYDAPTEEFLAELSDRLAERTEEPDWAEFSKTGPDRELPPQQEDFWHNRAASLLRKVDIRGPIGIERLSTEYGGSKSGSNRYRVSPASHSDGSKNIIRTILQQLEEEDLVETAQGEGRRITSNGRSLLDEVAADVIEELDRPELERYA